MLLTASTPAPLPALNALGRLLPTWAQDAVRRHAHGLDVPAVLADLFLDHPTDAHGFDPAVARRSYFFVAQTICRYFRSTVIDAHHIPEGRALLVGCHSGVVAWDATVLVPEILRHTGRFSRNTGDFFFAGLGPLSRFLAASGVVIGRPDTLVDLLRHEALVLLFPGGAADMCRPIWERYRVRAHRGWAPGHGGYVKVALRAGAPIVPMAIVGAEEVHGLLTDMPPLARLLGTPFFPIVLSPFPLPARIYLRFGEPIRLDAPPAAATDQVVVDELNVTVRDRLQALIDDTVRRRRGIYCSRYDGRDRDVA
jgi:1-acyl-sn-glycerol-3-phosphate acyltransferase